MRSSTVPWTRRSRRSRKRSAYPASGPARRRAGSSKPASVSTLPGSRHCRTRSRSTSPGPCASTMSISRHARGRTDRWGRRGPGRVRCHVRGASGHQRAGLRRPPGRARLGHRQRRRVQQAVDAERARHGSLADLDRPADAGDFVTLDCRRPVMASPSPG